ncbi:MAG: thioredoxin [Acutalibacteraceae bacterium]
MIKMAELNITSADFEEKVLKSEKPVLLDFWAVWCGPCQMLAPVIHEIAEERSDIRVGKVNVDDEIGLARQFGIDSIPTLLVFKNGELVNRAVGVLPKESVLKLVD